jgi:hypothetical protein
MIDWTGKPLTLAKYGAIGAVAAFLPGEIVQSFRDDASTFLGVIARAAIWIGVLGIGCATALVIGQNRYLRRPWLGVRDAAIAVGGGLLAGMISGVAAQVFFSMALLLGSGNAVFGETARVVAWGIFGALIGFGMAFIIPNLGRMRGVVGGAVAGALGGIGFIVGVSIGGNEVGRLVGMTAVGFVLGYVIGLVEQAARTAWLQVSYGQSRETVRVSLGPELVCVGSNSQRCAIWAQGARSIALRFRYVDGRVICDDMNTERTAVVESGFQQQVGNVNVMVCVGEVPAGRAAPASQAVPTPAATPRPPAPPVPVASSMPVPAVGAPARPAAPTRAAAGPRPAPPPPPPPPPPPATRR